MHAGPKKAGYKSDAWPYHSLHAYVLKRVRTDRAYSTFVANLHEAGIVLETALP